MLTKTKFTMSTLMIAFVFMMSAIYVVPAYADGETPPVEPPAATDPVEPPTQDSATEDAVPTPLDSAPVIEEIPAAESVESILAEIPQGTELVILNETGEAVPLATQEAAQVILEGDPMWCPVGITPGGAGCTTSTTSFATMLTNLTALYGAAGPNKAGVIWIEGNYDSTTHDNAAINFIITGSTLTAMKSFALTLQGGWTGAGKTIDTSNPSDFHIPLSIIGWEGDVTLSNITFSNTTTGGNALQVGTTKNIVLTNIISQNNAGRGAALTNNSGGSTGNVTVTNSKFNGQTGDEGLMVFSNGTISVKDVTATLNGYGAFFVNSFASSPKAVTLSGTNTFSNNSVSGLDISSKGLITINNTIASNNGNVGADLDNSEDPAVPSGIVMTGTNIFNDNGSNGLVIQTYGAVKINNLYANSNTGLGASIQNNAGNAPQPVTLTGTNEFKYNTSLGLVITSEGAITLSNISANSNGNTGAALNNNLGSAAASVTLTGNNFFNSNFNSGLNIQSFGTVTINNITANGNGASLSFGYGATITNGGFVNFKGVTLTGFNSFNDNYNDGLTITSSGVVTLNNITANNTLNGAGTVISNLQSGVSVPKAVTLNGTNFFNFNRTDGLTITSYGAVTLNNITASNNGHGLGASFGGGVIISNQFSTNPQKVTLKGTNTFNDNLDSGLYIASTGAILTNAITATGNDEYGVYLSNGSGTATSTIGMTGANMMTGNVQDNLYVYSASTITLSNITANSSTSGYGANIQNTAGVAKAVTISGTNAFDSNGAMGLLIVSNGLITLNNITASNNASHGAYLSNAVSTTKAGVTLNGVNTFNGNMGGGDGLQILSSGNVKTNAVAANSNTGYGVFIDITTLPGAIGSVTMNGANNFNANGNGNLDVRAVGAVILNSINSTASVNGSGASIINTAFGAAKPVTLNGASIFSNNANANGLVITTYGVITTNNITASNNGNYGASFSNTGGAGFAGINILGTNVFNTNITNNLYVESTGLIKTNNITANNSADGYGASLNNNFPGSTAGITMTGINQFNNNRTNGLEVYTNSVITASNITASFTTNGYGALFTNTSSGFATPKAITLSGSNNFNNNKTNGLNINSYGAITINNLTANYNGQGGISGIGAFIDNSIFDSTIASSVNLTGNNTFLGNYQKGLRIESFGAIKVNNLKADDNGSTTTQSGAELFNHTGLSNAFGITLSGTNTFNNNGDMGLYILTKGAVLLNNINASGNSNYYGLWVDNTAAGILTPKPVTLTGTNTFNSNGASGFYITTYGVVTANNVTASDNTGYGGFVDNSTASTPANIVFTGFNTFNNNNQYGLYISSKGAVTLSNITANDNTFTGLFILNTAGSGGVTLTGVNTFNKNSDGGAVIVSDGAVSITKATGDENGISGLVVSTTAAVTLTCGSFNMNGNFGWEVSSASSLLTVKGVFTAGNGLGHFSNNALSTITVRNCP